MGQLHPLNNFNRFSPVCLVAIHSTALSQTDEQIALTPHTKKSESTAHVSSSQSSELTIDTTLCKDRFPVYVQPVITRISNISEESESFRVKLHTFFMWEGTVKDRKTNPKFR